MPGTGATVQEIQERIIQMQRQLERETVYATVGNVTVEVSGCLRIVSVHIAANACGAGDSAALENGIVQAVNEALDKARSMAQTRINALASNQ